MPRSRRPPLLDFAAIVGLWPSIAAFCRAVGVPDATARAWHRRGLGSGRIPVEYWDRLIAAAEADGIEGVSLDSLMAAVRIAMAREQAEVSREASGVKRMKHANATS